MNLYRITYHDVDFYVEAESMTAAIGLWRKSLGSAGVNADPEGCEQLSDTSVIRR